MQTSDLDFVVAVYGLGQDLVNINNSWFRLSLPTDGPREPTVSCEVCFTKFCGKLVGRNRERGGRGGLERNPGSTQTILELSSSLCPVCLSNTNTNTNHILIKISTLTPHMSSGGELTNLIIFS